MTKQEAIARLRQMKAPIEPEQDFTIDRMQPADAWGVARCFFAIYGDQYPVDTCYLPDALIAANQSGEILSAVARTPRGEVVGYEAVYRSSPPYPRLYEFGQGVILPDYRATFAIFCLQSYLLQQVVPTRGIDALFGEPVCDHVISQRLCLMEDFRETALELELMPAGSPGDQGATGKRVSALMAFKELRNRPRIIYLPEPYAPALAFLAAGMACDREMRPAACEPPPGAPSQIDGRYFATARVARFNVPCVGRDFAEVFREREREALQQGALVLQVFLNLGQDGLGEAVAGLRARGYFLGGYLPRWFDADGLLLQKLLCRPDFGAPRLASDQARRILALVREDYEQGASRG